MPCPGPWRICGWTGRRIARLLVSRRSGPHPARSVFRTRGRPGSLRKEVSPMSVDKINTLVVGAGQAGLAMSEHLRAHGLPHLVLERDRIAERWRTGRWDSLVANGPAWHDRFPNLQFDGVDPDGFAGKERVADYFVVYAEKFHAPVRTGVEVTSVRRNAGRPGFRAETSAGTIDASYVVAATGPFQRPVI